MASCLSRYRSIVSPGVIEFQHDHTAPTEKTKQIPPNGTFIIALVLLPQYFAETVAHIYYYRLGGTPGSLVLRCLCSIRLFYSRSNRIAMFPTDSIMTPTALPVLTVSDNR